MTLDRTAEQVSNGEARQDQVNAGGSVEGHDRLNEAPHRLVALVIAICRKEVEAVIGEETIDNLDDGSPWGRAYIKACGVLKEMLKEVREGQPG